MRTIEAVRRSGVGVGPSATIHDAAVLMEKTGVGSLAILDRDELVGIVTDRDLVRRGMARGLAPDARVDGVMSSPVVTISADADLHAAFSVFGQHALRRLAVVEDGRFVGMISVDDLLVDLVSSLGDLVRPVTAEVLFAHRDSPVPATT
jgi:CBS domain-containing protein